MIKKEKGRYNVYTEDGSRKLGSHPSMKKATAQLQAIEISKHKEAQKKK